ncbi:MAG: hypothetical protein AB1705_24065 [Verrucomicrobiota bacterium]
MDDDKQLESLIHAELRKLPEVPAPANLMPRVLARLEARRPWWQKSWFAWPATMQVASVLLWLGVVGAVGFFGLEAWHGLQATWNESVLRDVLVSVLGALATSARASLATLNGQLWVIAGAALGLMVAMYLICVAAGSAFYRAFVQKR